MNPLERLNRTLISASIMLDNAASQIRDAALSPTKQHIYSVGEALTSIHDIQQAIYKLKPELEPKFTEESEETQAANRRLGEALIAAYDLADKGQVQEGVALLDEFANNDPSKYHRELAATEKDRLARNYGI
jgi:hypothetical protein